MSERFTDVHAHFLTDEYVAAARAAGIDHPDGMPGWPSFDLADQLASMDRRGIGRAVLSISSPGVSFVPDDPGAVGLAEHVNDAAVRMIGQEPDRLAFLASLPLPDVDAAVRELRRVMDAGAVGAIVESNVHGRYLDDPEFEPVWAELDRRGGILFVHPTSPPAWEQTSIGLPRPMLEFMIDSTRNLVAMLRAGLVARHRGVRLVIPHSGAAIGVLADRVGAFLPMLVDPDAGESWWTQLAEVWFDMAGTPFPRAIPSLTSTVGTSRILYGSDSCWTPPAAVDAQLASIDAESAPAGAASWRAVTAANAARLLRFESDKANCRTIG